jgi:glycosyltransferase involved in cell wall biosynthesis
MARVLLLTHTLPYPLDAGAKVRQYHMLGHLAHDHQVTLVSFVRPEDAQASIEHLRGICQAVHTVPVRRSALRNVRAGIKGLLVGLPMTIVRDENRQMAATLRRVTHETAFDVIHADQLSMAWYGRMAARLAAGAWTSARQVRTLLDEHNAVYLLARRMADTETKPLRRVIMAREARAFARYERAMCRFYDALLTVIPEDRGRLLALLPEEERGAAEQKFAVIPICVDPEQVAPVAHQDGKEPTVLHLGTMFWPPNIQGVLWFAREVLPLIHQQRPETRFVVVGKDPPPEVRALVADPRIEVTGYVDDLSPYLVAADVFVVPLHAGGGMRVKILDAWMWGLPIISTPIGAEGIELTEGENILLAGDARAFAQATLRVLGEDALNQRLRTEGRVWVEARYSWQAIYEQVDQVYARLLHDN